jgi:hypothetical protein
LCLGRHRTRHQPHKDNRPELYMSHLLSPQPPSVVLQMSHLALIHPFVLAGPKPGQRSSKLPAKMACFSRGCRTPF